MNDSLVILVRKFIEHINEYRKQERCMSVERRDLSWSVYAFQFIRKRKGA